MPARSIDAGDAVCVRCIGATCSVVSTGSAVSLATGGKNV